MTENITTGAVNVIKETRPEKEPPTKLKDKQKLAEMRRHKVWEGLCEGEPLGAIAERVGVSYRTIERDVKEILAPIDLEKEKAELREDIKWDRVQATQGYLKAQSNSERREWLDRRIRINGVRASYLKGINVNVTNIENQTNMQKIDVKVLLAGIAQDKQEREKKKMEAVAKV